MSIKLSLESIFPELYEAERAGDNVVIPPEAAEAPEDGAAEPAGQEVEVAAEPEPEPDMHEHATGVPYAVAVGGITQKLQTTLTSTAQAVRHMAEQRRQAATQDKAMLMRKDAAYGYDHRKTGLPTDPSHLELDAATMSINGLMEPHELLRSVQAERAKRASVEAAAVSAKEIALGNLVPPHYAAETKSHEGQIQHFTVVAGIVSVRQMRDAARSLKNQQLGETKALFETRRQAEPGYDAAEAEASDEAERRRRAGALKKDSPAVIEAQKRLIARVQVVYLSIWI